jgi:aminoglycoside 6'-N-acetyltransferase
MDPLPCLGGRVVLRRFRADDLPEFQAYRSDPALRRYQGWLPMPDPVALEFLREMAKAPICTPGEWMQLAISAPAGGPLLGDIGLHRRALPSSVAEIGYTLIASRQGKGLATEAVGLALGLLWAETDVHCVEAITDARNHASVRLLSRLGFTFIQEEAVLFQGEPCVEQLFRLERP